MSAHLWDFPPDLKLQPIAWWRSRGQREPAGANTVNSAPIGIFDSGIGGLTVTHSIFERLPHESTIYFGDTARVPYGPKSPGHGAALQPRDSPLARRSRRQAGGRGLQHQHGSRASGPAIRVAGSGHRSDRAGRYRCGRGDSRRSDRCDRYRRDHREQCLREGDPRTRSRAREWSRLPARCSCLWWRRDGSSIQPRS